MQLAAGLRPGDRVAYLDKNHPACVETSLACLLIGTANAVVNFRLAPDEIRYVINDAQAQVVFVGTEFLPVLAKIRDDLPTVERVIVVGGEPGRVRGPAGRRRTAAATGRAAAGHARSCSSTRRAPPDSPRAPC